MSNESPNTEEKKKRKHNDILDKTTRIRWNKNAYEKADEWRKLHFPGDFSKFVRSAVAEYMYRETPLTSELDEMKKFLIEKLDQQTKILQGETNPFEINDFLNKGNTGQFRRKDEHDIKQVF